MPRLWSETVGAHREEVRHAIIDAALALANEQGPLNLTMSQVAERAGIGRATLYKYFPDVESVLLAWHEVHVAAHLRHLTDIAAGSGSARDRLVAVLEAYASIRHRQPRTDLAAVLHRGRHVAAVERQLHALVRDLLGDAAAAGEVRGDVSPAELARFCLHALSAAGDATSKAAVQRLVDVVLTGIEGHRPVAGRSTSGD